MNYVAPFYYGEFAQCYNSVIPVFAASYIFRVHVIVSANGSQDFLFFLPRTLSKIDFLQAYYFSLFDF